MSNNTLSDPKMQQHLLQQMFVDKLAPEILQSLIIGSVNNPKILLIDALRYFPGQILTGYQLNIYLDHITLK